MKRPSSLLAAARRRPSPWLLVAAVFLLLLAVADTVAFCIRPLPVGIIGLTNYAWAYILFDTWRRR